MNNKRVYAPQRGGSRLVYHGDVLQERTIAAQIPITFTKSKNLPMNGSEYQTVMNVSPSLFNISRYEDLCDTWLDIANKTPTYDFKMLTIGTQSPLRYMVQDTPKHVILLMRTHQDGSGNLTAYIADISGTTPVPIMDYYDRIPQELALSTIFHSLLQIHRRTHTLWWAQFSDTLFHDLDWSNLCALVKTHVINNNH